VWLPPPSVVPKRLPAASTYTHTRCGRSAEDGSSRVPLPGGRTPRPFAVRVPRGPHSTPPTMRAGPTPAVAGCSRAIPERPLPKSSHLVVRNPSAPPIRPDPTTLRPRLDSPVCFAIATPSPAPRPPSALRSRRSTTFQVQDAGSTPRGRHRANTDRDAMGWLVGHRWAPHRQDSLGLEFGMLRTSLPLVLPVDCVCRRTSRGVDRTILVRKGQGSGRSAMPSALQHAEKFRPWPNGLTVLERHHPRDLVQMSQVMSCPCRQ